MVDLSLIITRCNTLFYPRILEGRGCFRIRLSTEFAMRKTLQQMLDQPLALRVADNLLRTVCLSLALANCA